MKRFLVVTYDVSDLTEEETDGLAGEAHAVAERSDLHDSVGVVSAPIDSNLQTFTGTFTGAEGEDPIVVLAEARTSPAKEGSNG